ncbi:DUF1852 domain-containing protein [Pseudomonas entomophila]|uniref:DUF1852 domain-containing protein n=1 Tax=Pseudomonas entomophila TaxID=312306 RepID=UPI0015E409C5|nr:DUF1852 domain-containing protein [Pseudomonas entomophila]MBA1192602.1 DUF1852 domain-containing protein [Pseudomonas entomophila]
MTCTDFRFSITTLGFDEHYRPSSTTRVTTNFANLARGERRQENLRNTLRMIDNRFNALAQWDNPEGDRYALELDIVSVDMHLATAQDNPALPLIEMLKTTVLDRQTGERSAGMVGNNFSSYLRDYDFSIVLPAQAQRASTAHPPAHFGELHGKLFKCFIQSSTYRAHFDKPPVICLSVSSSKTYYRTDKHHPVLGLEYQQDAPSLTDAYFAKMGLQVRYFMPPNSVAPLAFYFMGDLLADYSNLELISTISTMDTFQKIYRPELYNANSAAGKVYRPTLQHQDYSLTRIVYDREERSRLAVEQARFVEAHFITPYHAILEQWSANYTV